jgi:mannan endo-1,4-beta-mannosidase
MLRSISVFFAIFLLAAVCVSGVSLAQGKRTGGFVSVQGSQLFLGGRPYLFVGTNYWYGSLLGLESDQRRGIQRLRRELDFLKSHGVTNLRLMAGAEGSGELNGVRRVGPPIQPRRGEFDDNVLKGLDLVLNEMSKRQMKAVIFLSNNWEWSGGFQQYLIWDGKLPAELLTIKPTWDELRDAVSKFYTCGPCIADYNRQVEHVITRRNSYSGLNYKDDPAIMAWELANEPRPMRPNANDAYVRWITETAAKIKRLDPNHLVTTGHEGWIGTESVELFEKVHAVPNVDYITIHIWPKNWAWFRDRHLAEDFDKAVAETDKYITTNAAVATRLNKPLVIEEFGLPRDGQSFGPDSTTRLRDKYYEHILAKIGKVPIAGANFWAFAGEARPRPDQPFCQPGDALMGDPPMEEQGLNSVFNSDRSTWNTIETAARRLKNSKAARH